MAKTKAIPQPAPALVPEQTIQAITGTGGDIKGRTRQEFERIYFIIGAIVIVLVMGFLALLITVWGLVNESNRERATSFQQLTSQVQQLNDKLNTK